MISSDEGIRRDEAPNDVRPPAQSRTSDAAAQQPSGLLSQVVTERHRKSLETHAGLLDPGNDGWDSERFTELAQTQLRTFANWLDQDQPGETSGIESMVADDFRCQMLRPEHLVEVRLDERTSVFRYRATDRRALSSASGDREPLPLIGLRGLTTSVTSLQQLGTDGAARLTMPPLHYSLKIDGVRRLGDSVIETSVMVEATPQEELSSRKRNGVSNEDPTRQLNAHWVCRWRTDGHLDSNALPQLDSILVRRHEEVVLSARGGWAMVRRRFPHRLGCFEYLLRAAGAGNG